MPHWYVNEMEESNKRRHQDRLATTYKTYVVGYDDERPLLFTPTRYDASTGQLHGIDHSARPMTVPMSRLLLPYVEEGLDWDEDEGDPFGMSEKAID